MTTDLGRPRDPRIDGAVLRATVELLAETGYADLLVSAIAERAGTSKPAIYRRWPSKAHLVHEAVFPIGDATALPDTGSLAEDLREMVRRTAAFLTTPAARAALPGLVGEMAADLTLHSALLERFGDIIGGGLAELLQRAADRGRGTARRHRRRVGRGHRRHHLDGPAHPRHRTRRHLGRSHRHTAHERNQRMTHESTAAWRELLDTLGGLDRSFLDGDRAVTDDRHIADGYRMLATTLGVASTPICSANRAGRCSSRSTPRSGATGDGAATTPTPTTSSARSIRSGAIESAATGATASTSR